MRHVVERTADVAELVIATQLRARRRIAGTEPSRGLAELLERTHEPAREPDRRGADHDQHARTERQHEAPRKARTVRNVDAEHRAVVAAPDVAMPGERPLLGLELFALDIGQAGKRRIDRRPHDVTRWIEQRELTLHARTDPRHAFGELLRIARGQAIDHVLDERGLRLELTRTAAETRAQ